MTILSNEFTNARGSASNNLPEKEKNMNIPRLKPCAFAVQYACYAIGYQWRAARGLEQPR